MDGSIAIAMLAGAAGGVLLLGGRALSMRVDPRPCWEKGDCSSGVIGSGRCAFVRKSGSAKRRSIWFWPEPSV